MKKFLKKIIPWLFAGLIFFLLFRKIPPREVLETFRYLNVPFFVFLTVTYFTGLLLIDCWGLQWILTRFSAPFRYGETILMRGATYLLMLINYGLGQGGIAFYAKQTHDAPIFKTLGCVFHLSLTDLFLFLVCGTLSIAFGDPIYRGVSLRSSILSLTLIAFASFIGMVFFWRYFDSPVVRFLRKLKLVDWILNHNIFHVYRESTWKDYLTAFLLRIPMVAIVVLSPWFALAVFDVSLPIPVILTYLPIMMIVGTLPITPVGLGTIQVLAVEFFAPHISVPAAASGAVTPETLVLASSILWVFANILLKSLFGFYCLGRKSKKLFEAVD